MTPRRRVRIQKSVPLGSGARSHRVALPLPVPISVVLPISARGARALRFRAMDDSLVIGLEGGPGIRDAEEILIRAREDEREAFEARTQYWTRWAPDDRTRRPGRAAPPRRRDGLRRTPVLGHQPAPARRRHRRLRGQPLPDQPAPAAAGPHAIRGRARPDRRAGTGRRASAGHAGRRHRPIDRCRPAAATTCPDRGGFDRRSLTLREASQQREPP